VTACLDDVDCADEQLRMLADAANFHVLSQVAFDGILMEYNGLVEESNEALAAMLGYTPDELRGVPVASLLRPDARTWSEGRVEGKGIRRDGTTFPVALCIATASAGQRIYAVRDVTKEKLAQQQLHETERRYRELSETTHDLLCLHDLDGRVLEVNSAALRATGYTWDELRGVNIRKMLPAGSVAAFDQYLATITEEGVAEGRMTVVTKRGDRRLWHYRNLVYRAGDQTYVRGLARDVTEQVQAAAALQKSEQHFRSIIENISDTITILDASGYVQYRPVREARSRL
jgi:PAS domain S-box-containing protein